MTVAAGPPVHATAVAIGGRGVLIEGPSGAGKSDLALRLIDRGALLVSDDYTHLAAERGTVYARPPATIAGRLEVRGVGIIALPFAERVPVALVVHLGEPDRLPAPQTVTHAGVVLPVVTVRALEPSAPVKVELALERFR